MKHARAIIDAVPQLIASKNAVTLSPNGADGLQLAVGHSFDKSRPGDRTAITNQLVLDVMRLCERLGMPMSEKDLAPAE